MQQLLYREVPTPAIQVVLDWLWCSFCPLGGKKTKSPSGCILEDGAAMLSVFVWTVQRSCYLKVFRWSARPYPKEKRVVEDLGEQITALFPHRYPVLPPRSGGIFTDLESTYPRTVEYFQRFPQGEFDLERVYWWEKKWRSSCIQVSEPPQVISREPDRAVVPEYDLVCVGGALGAIHGAMMAKLGYKVCLIERLPFARMNREWNISRQEFQCLIDLDLFTIDEFESVIAKEYRDGFHKFFDGNNPSYLRSPVLHTPTVLNIALDSEKLLSLCGQKLEQYGAHILDRVEFDRAVVATDGVVVYARRGEKSLEIQGRVLIDAMGSASPIASQVNNGRAFDSVCPTVGAVIKGLDLPVWDSNFGDVLASHGDISRGRQLIWELFPGKAGEVTIYLFHYHQIHPQNPGSLLEMYEDFFSILPEYRRCDPASLTWIKPTFGYIPAYFSLSSRSRLVAYDRVLSIGDAAALQSPLVFTGFGSLVRNLPRLTQLLDRALGQNLLDGEYLQQINTFQSNVAVTWLFSKGMMVPTGMVLPPERINAMLNTFFGVLAQSKKEVADNFIKDRVDWLTFNRLALVAAFKNPRLIGWIWHMAGGMDFLRWLGSYTEFTLSSLNRFLFASWLPVVWENLPASVAKKFPRSWWRISCWLWSLKSKS